jgi:serine/threonine-protein kinase
MQQGLFPQARAALRRGLEVLPTDHPSRRHLSELARECDQLLALEKRLPAVLKGEDKPRDAVDCLALAWLCGQPYHGHYTAAARLYAESFAAQPKLADDLSGSYRYLAACAAVLTAAGRDAGGARPDAREQTRLRGQALSWLKADLAAWNKLGEGPAGQRQGVRRALAYWRVDATLAGVRDKAAREKLPAAERNAWRKLWADLDDLDKRLAEKK